MNCPPFRLTVPSDPRVPSEAYVCDKFIELNAGRAYDASYSPFERVECSLLELPIE